MADLFSAIRKAIVDAIPETSFNSAKSLSPRNLYIPPAHIKSLQLYHNLIIGARGVGKTTWTRALGDETLRNIIGVNIPELKNIKVRIGFSESSIDDQYPSPEVYGDLLQKNFSAYAVWQTILARWLCKETGESIPVKGWIESVTWTQNNPEAWTKLLQRANDLFESDGKNGLIVFDALDRSGNTWEKTDEIVRDLLRLTVRLKSYSNIHAKIFLREDQLSRTVTDGLVFLQFSMMKSKVAFPKTEVLGKPLIYTFYERRRTERAKARRREPPQAVHEPGPPLHPSPPGAAHPR
ncbi:MAG: hypothetical protein LBD96_09730, partial [Treponema sp.]|nr:hypothetical protein [Treponema sp.]